MNYEKGYGLYPEDYQINRNEAHDLPIHDSDKHDKTLISNFLDRYREEGYENKKNDDPETRIRIAEFEAEVSRKRAENAERRETQVRAQLEDALGHISSLTEDLSIAQVHALQAEQRAENAERREVRTSEQLDEAREKLRAAQGENERLRQTRQESKYANDNPYLAALGIHPDAFLGRSDDQVKAIIEGAYKTFVRIDHPDRGGDTQRMQGVNAAYDYLIKDGNYRLLRR